MDRSKHQTNRVTSQVYIGISMEEQLDSSTTREDINRAWKSKVSNTDEKEKLAGEADRCVFWRV